MPKLSKRRRATRSMWRMFQGVKVSAINFEVGRLQQRVIMLAGVFEDNWKRKSEVDRGTGWAEALRTSPNKDGVRYRTLLEVQEYLTPVMLGSTSPNFTVSLLRDRARRFLAAQPGKRESFYKPHAWGSQPDDELFIAQHFPPNDTTLTLDACKWLWWRGNVYRQWADDLEDLLNRWKLEGYRSEFDNRFYDKRGRLIQPKVPVRPRTVKKINAQRVSTAKPYTGRFLDS